MGDFATFVIIGICAQLVDGALGMAYGVTASTLLLGAGLPPASVSATVHAAEVFSTGASALSHRAFGNVDRVLFWRLTGAGVVGAVLGAYVLTSIDGDKMRPFIAGYLLLMGVVVLAKAFREIPPRSVRTHLIPLGFTGAFVDAIGGGGWGPIVASTLLVRGNEARTAVGTVNAVEFFVTLAASITFLLTIGLSHWEIVAGLALGGFVAAPFGAWLTKRLPMRAMLVLVGLLIIALSIRTIVKAWA
jgi:uncharacterized membrane protein YfcA